MHKGFVIILKAIMALLFIITFVYIVAHFLGIGKVAEWSYTTPWEDRDPPKLYEASATPKSLEIGEEMTITAKVSDDSGIAYVKAKIQNPDEKNIAIVDLYDDGSHNDGSSGDYIYGNTWTAPERGTYYVDLEVCDTKGNCKEYENI
jgi:lipopolysaccharide export LptBFGC system permease protein LptF